MTLLPYIRRICVCFFFAVEKKCDVNEREGEREREIEERYSIHIGYKHFKINTLEIKSEPIFMTWNVSQIDARHGECRRTNITQLSIVECNYRMPVCIHLHARFVKIQTERRFWKIEKKCVCLFDPRTEYQSYGVAKYQKKRSTNSI